ncbi:MAG: DUF262 domain-containing protein, partial [Chloroflexi bacterium]|nr:DUF262 domain-containing protein [Chloroflexota bacterium]
MIRRPPSSTRERSWAASVVFNRQPRAQIYLRGEPRLARNCQLKALGEEMSKVIANTKSVKQLLQGERYRIDYYQRGYNWQKRHIAELLKDLASRFFGEYKDTHETAAQVRQYQHYFLGTIITIEESSQRFIVDGQQRLTTLTLLLIYIHHLSQSTPGIPDVKQLIYSDDYGEMSFNLYVPERVNCMKELYKHGHFQATEQHSLSVRNLAERYEDLEVLFDERLAGRALSYFVYWLIECVDLVEIEAQTDDSAFTIFETMNDRGMNLSQADMLKGYLLANINYADPNMMQAKKEEANDVWKGVIKDLTDLGDGEVGDFFKTWLRAKYAVSQRSGKRDAENKDFENIDKFHRWVRDEVMAKEGCLNLGNSEDFYNFITVHMQRYARHYIILRRAAHQLTPGIEAVHYNAHNNFTLQYMLALAPLRLDDDDETAKEKMRVVATFVDIYFVRRVVNYKSTGYSTLRYYIFNLTKEIRDKSLDELRDILVNRINGFWETFGAIDNFALHGKNKRHVRYMLARMTAWVERGSGSTVNYRDFLWDAKGKTIDIEHIWANKFREH